jgi:MFS family permease
MRFSFRSLGRDHPTAVAGALVVLLALGFRLANIGWQLPHLLHVDERPHVEAAINQALHGEFTYYYSNQPPGFRHLLTVEVMALDRLGLLGGELREMDDLLLAGTDSSSTVVQRAYLLGRLNSAAFGTATVVMLFLASRALLGTATALFASLALTLSLTHIRESHFATTTVTGLFFATVSLYFSSIYLKRGGGWILIIAACLASAIAVTIRDLMLAAALFPLSAVVVRAPRLRDWKWWLWSFAVAVALLIAAVLAFALTTPYERDELLRTGNIHLPKLNRTIPSPEHIVETATFYLGVMAQSLGVPMLLTAMYGMLRMAVRRPQALILNGVFSIAIVAALVANSYSAVRFAIPLELLACVCAGYGIADVVGALRRANSPKAVQASAALLPFASLFVNASVLTWIMSNRDTRVLANDWALETLPTGSTVYAPRFTLPAVRDDIGSTTPVTLAAIRPDQIATTFTGEGCSEYVVLSSIEYDLTGTASPGMDNAIRDLVRNQGSMVARFSPWRSRELPSGPDEGFAPLWNLFDLLRPGPIVEIYSMSPQCSERAPSPSLTELVALSEISQAAGVMILDDPRLQPREPTPQVRADGLPKETRGIALGRFIPGDSGLALAAVFRDRREDYLGIYRLGSNHPPQLVMLDREFVDCNCTTNQGLSTLPSDNGGLDQLAILGREQGVQRIDVLSFNGGAPQRSHRWRLSSPEGIPASSMASVPADMDGGRRLALLYLIGSELRIRVLNADPSVDTLDLRNGSLSMAEFRLPSDNSNYLPVFAIGDFDGNGRNDVALAEAARPQAQIFRMPVTELGETGSLARIQTRGTGSGTQLLQTVRPDAWPARSPASPDLVALDWVGTDMQLVELSIDRASPFPLRMESAPGVVISDRSTVIGLAGGRFLKGESFPSVAVMTQEGRTVSLDLYRRNANGVLDPTPIPLDRWRTEADDKPLRNSLAAVDLDGDGIDELANGRIAGTNQDIQEFHFHSLTLSPRPEASLVRIDRDIVPPGAELSAISTMPYGDRGSGNLAVAYRMADRDMMSIIEVRTDVPAHRIREVSWISETGRLSGLAAMPAGSGEPAFAIVERGHEGQNLVRTVTINGSQPESTPPFAWPNIRDRGVWVTSAR